MDNSNRPARVVGLLLVSLLLVPLSSALLDENQSFQSSHSGVDYPVGYTEFNLGGTFSPEVRMVYPAMANGEDKDMAGNGPFPWLMFIGDTGESIDGYMLLSEKLVQRGYIVVVGQPMSDETDVEATMERLVDVMLIMEQQNQSNIHVLGSAGNIDHEHWGIAGHGKGATAAYLAYPFWELSGYASTHQPPRSLFGLGLDLENVESWFTWDDITSTPSLASPNTGFFLTGTVDEIAPSQETMERVEALGGIGWHWMHVLGADHYQFQDTRSFFENEGDATMSQSAQIQLTADHIVPYLDTVLRGDHERFRAAFNRADGPHTVSDSSAYVDESLVASSFLRMENITVNHNASVELNASQTFELHANWTLRNGDGYADVPAGWDINISCGWATGVWQGHAALNENGTASCSFPMATVAPGVHKAWMRVEVEGAPSTVWANAARGNTPLELLYPQPTVYVLQHGSKVLNISDVANDPDGQSVRAVNASLSGPDANHFALSVDSDGLSLVVEHALDEEWLGECQLELTLRSDGQVVDEKNTSIRVLMTPVNDPIVKSSTVPIQEMDEDGDPVVYDLGEVVSDPEGEPLIIRIDGETLGEQGPIRYVLEDERITITPIEHANGVTVLKATVSDGYNPSLELEIPVVVNAVDDPVMVNMSAWGNLSFDEDTVFTLDVEPLAYDVDGDELVWTLEGGGSLISADWENGSFVLSPKKDYNGLIDDLWLNVSDGTSSHEFQFSIELRPVGDLPFVAIGNIQRVDGSSTATMQWSLADVDGTANTEALVMVNEMTVTVNHSCLSSASGVYQCVTLLPLPVSSQPLDIVVTVYDEELDRTAIASFVFDPNSVDVDNEAQDASGQDDSGLTTWVLLGLVLLGILAVAGFLITRGQSNGEAVVVASPPESVEETTDGESKGLLARAMERR